MGITAGFLAHTTMKLLLDYEEVSMHLQYNAKKEFFSNSVYPPNPECKDSYCLDQQELKKGKKTMIELRNERINSRVSTFKKEEDENKLQQADLDMWGIEVNENPIDQKKTEVTATKEDIDNQDLDDLAAQLKNM